MPLDNESYHVTASLFFSAAFDIIDYNTHIMS